MTLICSEEKRDLAAHVAAPILKQCGEIFLLVNSVLAMIALIYFAKAVFCTGSLLA